MASIRERTSEGATTYQVLFRNGSRQGSKTFGDKRSAERFVTRIDLDGLGAALAWLEDQRKGTTRAVGPLTVDQLAERWLEARAADVASGDLTPRVLTGYRRDYTNWVSPWLGHLPAADVTELHVQEWIDKIKTLPKSQPKSVADRHAILHGIYKWAANPRRALVSHNPCVGTSLPKRKKKPPKGLRLPEIHALTTTARSMSSDAADLIDFIAGTGWRLGESIALTTGQVEDDGTNVYVTMSRVWRREVGFTEGGKSGAALRRLRVLGPAVGALRRRVVGKGPADLVFTTAAGKPWDETTFRRDHFNKIAKAAGLTGDRRPTPHWVRHSHVLVCHAAGMSLAEIQRRIGHEDIKMTINTYGRLIDDMSDDVAERLDALLTPGVLASVVRGEVQSSSVSGTGSMPG